jgi:hypothetical protein
MVVWFLLDMGVVLYYVKINWIMLAMVVGYVNRMQRDIQSAISRQENPSE